MSRIQMFGLFYLAVFLQSGAYGLTFVLPRLFAEFGADEKAVGATLFVTALSTILSVCFAGHLSDLMGRLKTLALGCGAIAVALVIYAVARGIGLQLIVASASLGFGWGLTYSLAPVVLTRLVAPEARVRFFTLLSISVMAGFGLTPVAAGMAEAAGLPITFVFIATAGLCVAAGLIFLALSRPVRRHVEVKGRTGRTALSLTDIAAILRSRARLPIIMVLLGASVFAGMNNFQTVIAQERGLTYAEFFLAYTLTVLVSRVALMRFSGGSNPWKSIAILHYVMTGSVLLFMASGNNAVLYVLVAVLFGIGYGVSYPILAAMTAADARPELLAQTLQLFALSYFVGIFGFPLIAGWAIAELGTPALLVIVALLAATEATLALTRATAKEARPCPS